MLGPYLRRNHAPYSAQNQGYDDDFIEQTDHRNEIGNWVDWTGDVERQSNQPPARASRCAWIAGHTAKATREANQIDTERPKFGAGLAWSQRRSARPDQERADTDDE